MRFGTMSAGGFGGWGDAMRPSMPLAVPRLPQESGSRARDVARAGDGDSLETVLSYLETLLANAEERRQRGAAAMSQALSQAEHRSKSHDMDLSNRVDAVAATQEQTAKTLALDCLVIAALGVVGSSLGLLLSWPDWWV